MSNGLLPATTDDEELAALAQADEEELAALAQADAEDKTVIPFDASRIPRLTTLGGTLEGPALAETVGEIGRGIESVTAAPTRAGLSAAVAGEPAFAAFGRQFAEAPETAPTSEFITGQIAERGDITSPVALAAIETGITLGADWTNFLPILGPAAKLTGGLTKGTKNAVRLAAAQAAADAGLSAKEAPKAIKALSTPSKVEPSRFAKTAARFTPISAKKWELYRAKDTGEEVRDIIKATKGDPEEFFKLEENIKKSGQAALNKRRGELGEQLQDAIDSAPKRLQKKKTGPSVDPIVDALEASKATINRRLDPGSIEEINELIGKVLSVTKGKRNSTNVQNLHDVKQFLQDYGKGAFRKPGDVFTKPNAAERAAASASGVARRIFNKNVPAGAEANNAIHIIRKVIEQAPAGIIKEGSATALTTEGSRAASRRLQALRNVERVTGEPLVRRAEVLETAREFSQLPSRPTLESAIRAGAAGTIGGAAGLTVGGATGAGIGALATSLLSSPRAWKAAIDAGRLSDDLIRGLAKAAGPVTEAMKEAAFIAAQTPEGMAVVQAALKGGRAAGTLEEQEQPR